MRRPAALLNTVRQRLGRESLKELLDWMYAEYSSPEECRRRFWLWFAGITERQALGRAKEGFESALTQTADWGWAKLQRRVRATVEGLLSGVDRPTKGLRPTFPRTLATWHETPGRRLLMWKPTMPRRWQPEWLVVFAVDEAFSDLSGIDARTIGRCDRCKHYFVRFRAERGVYCSAACRYKVARGQRVDDSRRRSAVRPRRLAREAKR